MLKFVILTLGISNCLEVAINRKPRDISFFETMPSKKFGEYEASIQLGTPQ